jgi:hypothetical protein
MPDVKNNTTLATEFPNRFAYPYGNDGVIPLYSSIPLPTNPDCFPGIVCGGLPARASVLESSALPSANNQ